MPKFSKFHKLNKSQSELDFVDVSNDYDTRVYVDPFAIEICDDEWSEKASHSIRVFFENVLKAIRNKDIGRANNLMSNLHEPRETFLGVSSNRPQGLGVGARQGAQLIDSIRKSKAYKTGILDDLTDMALYVDGIDRDKISDLTTNVIRFLLVEYTNEQCSLHGVDTFEYNGPPGWDPHKETWISKKVMLPKIGKSAVMLVPKHIVRRNLSINSQDFYNKQITDFLVAENIRANSSLVQTIKGSKKVKKKDVRDKNPKSKEYIAEIVSAHPELLELYKELAKTHKKLAVFNDDEPSVTAICGRLVPILKDIATGAKHASEYQNLVMGIITALFYPDLIQPRTEWEIHDGRKRIDIVYTNAGDGGFFGQRRDDANTKANVVIVECKNYSDDLANPEIDQLLGRFDNNRGYFGILTYRSIDDEIKLKKRLKDAAVRQQGYILVLTDDDLINLLEWKASLNDDAISGLLYKKYRELLE